MSEEITPQAPEQQLRQSGQRRGFKSSAEVIAEVAAAPQLAEDPVMQEAILAAQDVEIITQEGVGLTGMGPEDSEVIPEEAAAEPEQKEPAKFRIKGRDFATQEEAWAFAEEEMAKVDAADALRQGIELGMKAAGGNPAPQPVVPAEAQEIDPEYYTNPQAYFIKREAQTIAKAQQAIRAEQQRAQTHEQTWSKFYTDYPDLTSAQEFVELTRQQNWGTLEHMQVEPALKLLAEKTRAKLKPIIEARMPKTVLPKVAAAATPGGAQQVTSQKTPSKPLSFVEQQRNLKKSRTQFR